MTRKLAYEPLEDRCPLAIVAITVNLYEDAEAGPGALIADDTVRVGERFYVEITVREYDPLVGGLRGVALDIAWDPAVFQEIDAEPVSTLVTPDLPTARTGQLDNIAGRIDNLAGAAVLADGYGRSIGNAKAERFSLLHFQAIQTAEKSLLSLKQGLSSIVTVPVFGLEAVDIYFERTTIKVESSFVGPLTAEEYFGFDAVFAELLDDNNKDECKWLGRTS